MIVRVHAFDWHQYADRIMPALARWLINEDETDAYQLFEQTRCAQEELFVPAALQQVRTWIRARRFVQQLPRQQPYLEEYAVLCDAAAFTSLSDTYALHHTPRLPRPSEALRTIWGALIQEYCLPWQHGPINPLPQAEDEPEMARGEMIALLHTAGLDDLIHSLVAVQHTAGEDPITPTSLPVAEQPPLRFAHTDSQDDEEDEAPDFPIGIELGRLPVHLQIRGWLARYSIRAMALFEFLACGRRQMPFGYQAGDAYGNISGYLTPEEVTHLADCLQSIPVPKKTEAEADFLQFREARRKGKTQRLIDELLPLHADRLVQAVQRAALQEHGLLCTHS
ncbi:hypothetical protein EI42_00492 [Thermosporothrix hazakensis]|jgi:hypothetical protein|uniref:Uncharacterized protein n=2 Tax=Thermosporothrix TaxID=768650 RepID=A0A326UCX3_THEHA|nr:hypothetical protein [Thermosporothrix hazakensis]PZW36318.1 hypothetical protein EI42_00492 [Thermosporothrix hazakensis]BBH88784.1 hypothetical protein KTC_35350 [Thermosporothrix sp. COM3]GCE46967.1 hypothetical protein KTH_18360 [Thermosporothrix hazakensis]